MPGRDECRGGFLDSAEFPRSAKYDPEWVLDNMMGPNALWLTESLAGRMNLEPNMRVLDMGCGKGLSSVFLAKEYGVEVWATDLWVDASDNFQRFCAVGIEDRVFPIHAEAHALPYADGFFDAMVSVDAYHYFGTDDLYLETHIARLIKPGGQMGIVVPGLVKELTSNEPPEHLRNYWEPALFRPAQPDLVEAPLGTKRPSECRACGPRSRMDGGCGWCRTRLGPNGWASPAKRPICLPVDRGRVLGFTRMVARRNERPAVRLDEL